MATPDHLSAIDALTALAPIIGAGGISGVVIAVLGYLKAQREGRAPSMGQGDQVALATLYADKAAIVDAAASIANLAKAIERLGEVINDVDSGKVEKIVDEVRELRRAIEDAADDLRRRE